MALLKDQLELHRKEAVQAEDEIRKARAATASALARAETAEKSARELAASERSKLADDVRALFSVRDQLSEMLQSREIEDLPENVLAAAQKTQDHLSSISIYADQLIQNENKTSGSFSFDGV